VCQILGAVGFYIKAHISKKKPNASDTLGEKTFFDFGYRQKTYLVLPSQTYLTVGVGENNVDCSFLDKVG
jgi:hypothetical protein